MMKLVAGLAAIASLYVVGPVSAQLTIETVGISPPTPTTTDSLIVSISGMLNQADIPTARTEWKRDASHIQVDVLIDFLGSGAPINMVPYTEVAQIGTLPVGTYDLTARVLGTGRRTLESPYPTPWHFPTTFFDTDIYTKTTTFAVVPEPSCFMLASVALGMLTSRRIPGKKPLV